MVMTVPLRRHKLLAGGRKEQDEEWQLGRWKDSPGGLPAIYAVGRRPYVGPGRD